MSRKGSKIGEKTVTLKRAPSADNSQNVRSQINVSGVGLDHGQEIYVKAFESHKSTGWGDSWESKVYNIYKRITFPKAKLESANLLPGDTVIFEFFELENGDLTESSEVIDRVNATKDRSNNDKVQSRLNSKDVYEYINERGGITKLKVRNVRTGKSTTYMAKSRGSTDHHHYRCNFPQDIREEIGAEPDDLIEVITTNESEDFDLSQREMVKEMYGMVTEMYDAYLENKNA
jgi:bifunctional DNA-binding transcriptional regulator/antitoxin component of YhaV-PrlF toxin-antitoxin module